MPDQLVVWQVVDASGPYIYDVFPGFRCRPGSSGNISSMCWQKLQLCSSSRRQFCCSRGCLESFILC